MGLWTLCAAACAATADSSAARRGGMEPVDLAPARTGGNAGAAASSETESTATVSSVVSTPSISEPALGAECARDRYQTQQTPLTLYTLFDESASMVLWWGPVTEAFNAFLRDPDSEGINIGLKFFGTECDAETYSKPDVPIGRLPENAEALANALTSRIPLAQTPTVQAIEGAQIALSAYAAAHPDEKVAILLVTDASSGIGEGDPEDCYSTVAQAAEVAAKARASNPPIETYVLGLGDPVGLNLLGEAGGTGDALVADPAVSDSVVAAIREVRRRALPCTYAVPGGAAQDPALVNLEQVDANGSTTTIPGVAAAQACDPVLGGWYYDNPDAPHEIISCRATCDALDSASAVHVIVGCPTLSPD